MFNNHKSNPLYSFIEQLIIHGDAIMLCAYESKNQQKLDKRHIHTSLCKFQTNLFSFKSVVNFKFENESDKAHQITLLFTHYRNSPVLSGKKMCLMITRLFYYCLNVTCKLIHMLDPFMVFSGCPQVHKLGISLMTSN